MPTHAGLALGHHPTRGALRRDLPLRPDPGDERAASSSFPALLIAFLAVRFSAFSAAFWSIVACLATSSLRRETRLGPRALVETLAAGARNSLVVGATAGVMGIVLAGVTLPGLALRFSSIIISYSEGFLPLALVLVAVASYIVLAILAGPALIDLGVPLLVAHLVIFGLSQDAALTPPFALGAFVAAGIAGAEPMRTGFTSLRLAKPLYLIPVLMVYTPLLALSGTWPEILATWLSCGLGVVCSSAALEGYLLRRATPAERILLGATAIALFWPSYLLDLIGHGLFVLLFLRQRLRAGRGPVASEVPAPASPARVSPSAG